jgi:mannonate dehydratase
MKRREFLLTAGAGVAVSRLARGQEQVRKQAEPPKKVLFKAGHQGHSSDRDLRMLAAFGVPEICAELPSAMFDENWSVESLIKLRKHVESFGIRLAMLPLPLSSHEISRVEFRNIMLGKELDRTREIEHVQLIIRNCADAGIPALKYNMSMLGVLRGRAARGRGGSRYSNFVWKEVKQDGPLTIAGELDEKTVWGRIAYFLERVVPVAEKCGVRMACHPHDPGLPPGEKHRGLPRVLGNVDGLKKFVEIAPSKYHGLNFCQGTIGEMLVNPRDEIYEVIRYFGTRGKIFNVHFRNIQGGFLDFRESYIDDGDMNMIEALRVYREVGFDGMIMPDHVPGLPERDADWAGWAFAFGYIKAAIQQVTDEIG